MKSPLETPFGVINCPDPHARSEAVRTGVYRYCELTDPDHPAYDHRYVELLERQAAGVKPEPVKTQTNPVRSASQPKLPPIGEQMNSLWQAGVRVVSSAIHQDPVIATPEIVVARLAACNGPPGGMPCEQRTEGGRCAGCGCWVTAKARLATESCPLGLWPEATP